jgi:hypothetical protein
MLCSRNTVTQYLIEVRVSLSDVIGSRAFPNSCHLNSVRRQPNKVESLP